MIAELGALGFEVVEVRARASDRSLEDLARANDVVGALRAAPGAQRVRLWVIDPSTNATAFEETVTIAERGRPDLLAVRAVEVLRARLVKVGIAPAASSTKQASGRPPTPPPEHPKKVAPKPRYPAPTKRREPVLWLGLGPAAQVSAGGLGIVPSALLDLRASPAPKWSLFGFVALPVTASRVAAPEGGADIEPSLAGAGATVHAVNEAWTFALGAGTGVIWVDMRGVSATRQYAARTDRVTALAGFGTMALCRRLVRGVGVCGDVWFGSAMPRIVTRFADHEVATWGRPFGLASLTLEIAVPGVER